MSVLVGIELKRASPYVTKYTDGAFLGSMREVTDIQATRKLLKDQFRFSPEIQAELMLRAVRECWMWIL